LADPASYGPIEPFVAINQQLVAWDIDVPTSSRAAADAMLLRLKQPLGIRFDHCRLVRRQDVESIEEQTRKRACPRAAELDDDFLFKVDWRILASEEETNILAVTVRPLVSPSIDS